MKRSPAWKTILVDVHSGKCQMAVTDESGEVLLEMQVRTRRPDLRRAIGQVVGPKRVIMENGPLAAFIREAIEDQVEELISADPTRNALIARSEHSTDELDARRLGTVYRAGGIHPVAIPEEPYLTLRSLLNHDLVLVKEMTSVRNRIKGLARRHGMSTAGRSIYRAADRKRYLGELPNGQLRWQLESLYRVLDLLRAERVGAHRQATRVARKAPAVRLLREIPGVGTLVAMTIVAWVMDPKRFHSRNAISSYGGLGLGCGITNWKQVSPTRASKRGNRALKRALFLAARAASGGANALGERYRARLALGWEDRSAIRDIARKILLTACAMIRTGRPYDETMVNTPTEPRTPPRRRNPRRRVAG